MAITNVCMRCGLDNIQKKEVSLPRGFIDSTWALLRGWRASTLNLFYVGEEVNKMKNRTNDL